MTTLVSPKRCAILEDAPQQFTALSGVTIWEGAVVGSYPLGSLNAGYLDRIEADPQIQVRGVARHTVVGGTANADTFVDEKIIPLAFGSTIDTSMRGALVYGVDTATGSLTPGSGPPIGMLMEVPSGTRGMVGVGPTFVSRALAAGGASVATSMRAVARVVVTSLAAYAGSKTGTLTASSNAAFGTQDGVATLAAGDMVFVQEGTTNLTDAADAGLWQILSLGSASSKWVLKRPNLLPSGAVIPLGFIVEIGGEGTGTDPGFAGTMWKSFAAKGKIVDTDAPVFWPRSITSAVTLASGTLAAARTGIPVRGATKTSFVISSNPATAPHATTRDWRVSALTAGVTGTSSVQMVAESAPGTTNTSDVGQYNLTANNW